MDLLLEAERRATHSAGSRLKFAGEVAEESGDCVVTVANGEGRGVLVHIEAIAVVCVHASEATGAQMRMPLSACGQVLMEFDDRETAAIIDRVGRMTPTLRRPMAFRPK